MSLHDDLTAKQVEQLSGVFRAEAIEHLKMITEILFTMEDSNEDIYSLLSLAVREAHNLKGSSGTLGFIRVSTMIHSFEDVLGLLISDHVEVTLEITDALLKTLKVMRNAILSSAPGDKHLLPAENNVIELLNKLFDKNDSVAPVNKYSISTEPILTKKKSLLQKTVSGAPVRSSSKPAKNIKQEFVRINQHSVESLLTTLDELMEASLSLEYVENSMVKSSSDLRLLSSNLSSLLNTLKGTSFEKEMAKIIDLTSYISSFVESTAQQFQSTDHLLNKLLARSQNTAREIKMAPLSSLDLIIKTQTREISRATKKQVSVTFSDGECFVDRAILEALEAPLIHILRNAIDHGIENQTVREKAGKNLVGKLTIEAKHTGDWVELRIKDDGQGVDFEKLAQKIVKSGKIAQSHVTDLSNDHLIDYLFESGFSTSQTVSQISGRGVGLDAVKYSIESIGGEVRLTSKTGVGTEIILRLPLTMSTIRCLLFEAGGQLMAFPASNVEKVLVIASIDVKQIGGINVIEYDGVHVPLASMEKTLQLNPNQEFKFDQNNRFAAILKFGERRYAFGFKQIKGYSQMIIKPLGDLLERVPNVSGLVFLGNGKLAIVLKPADLMRSASSIMTSKW